MKRGAPLNRRTPLGRGSTPLARVPLERKPFKLSRKDITRSTTPAARRVRYDAGGTVPAELRSVVRWTSAEWAAADPILWRRAAGRCEKCGLPLVRGAEERHHRKRRREGGDSIENLLLVHPGCHQHIHSYPKGSRPKGWIVSAFADPASVPVNQWGRDGWVLFGPDGSVTPVSPNDGH